jgi:hypothetical protein
MVQQRTEGHGKEPEHTHPHRTHVHDHYHVSHQHAESQLDEWEHRTHWHTHQHNHAELTHSHDYSRAEEDEQHGTHMSTTTPDRTSRPGPRPLWRTASTRYRIWPYEVKTVAVRFRAEFVRTFGTPQRTGSSLSPARAAGHAHLADGGGSAKSIEGSQ